MLPIEKSSLWKKFVYTPKKKTFKVESNKAKNTSIMKKFIIITIAAIVATVTLCSSSSSLTGNSSNGTVRFESTSIPALNFSMPVSRATDIFRLMPESVTSACITEYEAVREKCHHSSSFTHEGVKVRKTGENPSMTFDFSIPGYKMTVSDVSWEDLDVLFTSNEEIAR